MRALFLVLLAVPAPLAAQMKLAELAGLARARADRQRPQQEEALKPFWSYLNLDYRGNEKFLDEQFQKIAGIGDAVVPLLLEKLQPQERSPQTRQLAANCRRTLQLLDPGSFLDALAEMAAGNHDVARGEAIRLLGYAQGPRAVQVLLEALAVAPPDERELVVQALTRQRAVAAAPLICNLLGSEDRRTRMLALDFLLQAAPAGVLDRVLEAFSVEQDQMTLPLYVDYFVKVAPATARVADALLPLLDRAKLDSRDTSRVLKALATIAPKDHEGTRKRLLEMIEAGGVDDVELQAAITLRAIGEKSGIDKLERNLTEQLRRANRRREAALYELRGNLYFATEQWSDAVADYEKAVEFTSSSELGRRARFMIARVEARRHKWSQVIKVLKELGVTYDEVIALGEQDPAMLEALQQDKVRSFLQSLPRDEKAPANGEKGTGPGKQ